MFKQITKQFMTTESVNENLEIMSESAMMAKFADEDAMTISAESAYGVEVAGMIEVSGITMQSIMVESLRKSGVKSILQNDGSVMSIEEAGIQVESLLEKVKNKVVRGYHNVVAIIKKFIEAVKKFFKFSGNNAKRMKALGTKAKAEKKVFDKDFNTKVLKADAEVTKRGGDLLKKSTTDKAFALKEDNADKDITSVLTGLINAGGDILDKAGALVIVKKIATGIVEEVATTIDGFATNKADLADVATDNPKMEKDVKALDAVIEKIDELDKKETDTLTGSEAKAFISGYLAKYEGLGEFYGASYTKEEALKKSIAKVEAAVSKYEKEGTEANKTAPSENLVRTCTSMYTQLGKMMQIENKVVQLSILAFDGLMATLAEYKAKVESR